MANILVVYYYEQFPARATHLDYLYALKRYSGHQVSYINLRLHKLTDRIADHPWDAIIFDDLFCSVRWNRGLFMRVAEKVKALQSHPAVKAIMPQDEFISMDLICQFVKDFGVQHIFSVSPPSEWPKIYRGLPPSAQIHKVLTGYIDERLQQKSSQFRNVPRPIDVGYRTHRSPYWLGRHAQLKWQLGIAFAKVAPDLNTDISVERKDVITGNAWFDFLASCKYQLGIEGGASILDWDGTFQKRVSQYLQLHRTASFERVEQACFRGQDGRLSLFALSPRQFDCALTWTCQVMVEGEYDGIFKKWDHYIPLKRDLSDIKEVVDLVRDDKLREAIIEQTWAEIVESGKYTYLTLANQVTETMLNGVTGPSISPVYLELRLKDTLAWPLIEGIVQYKQSLNIMKGVRNRMKRRGKRVAKLISPFLPKKLRGMIKRNGEQLAVLAPDSSIHWLRPMDISHCGDLEFPLNMRDKVVPGDWDIKTHPFSELDTYDAIASRLRGVPWEETAYYRRVVNSISEGKVMWSCRTPQEFDIRCGAWDSILEDMKENGYRMNHRKPMDEITVNIGRDGQLLFNNGRHRLAMAQLAGIPEVPVRVTVRHPLWANFKQEIMDYAQNHQGWVYAPLLHPDLEDIPYLHTHERYEIIAASMSPYHKTLLDIGAHWGYFCIRFAREGMGCTAVEYGSLNARIMTRMRTVTNSNFDIVKGSIFTVPDLKYDVVLAMSIFHHFLIKEEKFKAFIDLLHRLDCQEMFVEAHNSKENQMQDAYMKLEPGELANLISRESCLKYHKRIGESGDKSGTVRGIYRFWR